MVKTHIQKYCYQIYQREEIQPIKFHSIDAKSVKKAILKTKVTARPSGLDVDDWKRILTLNQSGNSSNDLRKTFAEVIKNFVRHIQSVIIIRGIGSV